MARQNFKTSGITVDSIELGGTTDTTLARGAAGRSTIEGVNVPTVSSTDTLTNKTLTSPTINGGSASATILTGSLTAGGSTGTSGFFLKTTGTGVEWAGAIAPVTATTITTNSATNIYSYNATTSNAADLTIHVTQGNKRTSQKALVNHNASSTSLVTNYAVLEHGTTRIPLTVNANYTIAGLTWTTITSSIFSSQHNFRSIAYGNNLWVVVGDQMSGPEQGFIATSTDAITWVSQNANWLYSSGDRVIRSIAYGNNLWVVGGGYGGDIRSSTDAITWVTRTSNMGTRIDSVAFGNNTWVIGGYNGNIRSSTDAITWTTRASNFPSNWQGNIRSVAYGNNTWVAVGQLGNLRTSTDAITWTTRASNFGNSIIRCVAFGNNLWVAGGDSAQLRTSTDAITWTTRATNFPNFENITSVAFGNNLWVAGGNNGQLRTSTDAITWTTRTSNFSSSTILSFANGNNRWIATGYFGQWRTSTAVASVTATITDAATTNATVKVASMLLEA